VLQYASLLRGLMLSLTAIAAAIQLAFTAFLLASWMWRRPLTLRKSMESTPNASSTSPRRTRLRSAPRRKCVGACSRCSWTNSGRRRRTLRSISASPPTRRTSIRTIRAMYPYKDRIVAAGLQTRRSSRRSIPGALRRGRRTTHAVRRQELRPRPFAAVIEHVGSFANQTAMIANACGCPARRVRHHAEPVVPGRISYRDAAHPLAAQADVPGDLPPPRVRPLAEESTLNLMTESEIRCATAGFPGWRFNFAGTKLWGWKSNLILFAHRGRD